MNLTVRNHYNPCFWAALWNADYHRQFLANGAPGLSVRRQLVHSLSVKADARFLTTVENVHYDKHTGQAEITRSAAEDFSRRYHPESHEAFLRSSATAAYPLILDVENIFTGLESTPVYGTLLGVARKQELASAEDKVFLSCFLVLHQLRSHAIMNAMLEWHDHVGIPRFEHLVRMKWLMSDSDLMYRLTAPIAHAHWTLYVERAPRFPLCDNPILVSSDRLLVALSPHLLLEVLRHVPANDRQCRLEDGAPQRKIDEFRQRTIGNTFREIIFHEPDLLDAWRVTPDFRRRVETIRSITSYNQKVRSIDGEELWIVNAHGNAI